MENFIVSARKYRPSTFDSVVGQVSITRTLKNSIRSRHLTHAYLFCGPRGVGKTTCARIFAKTINCHNLTENAEACNECESCRAFKRSASYNIHELDAASNNSVDDIRNLIDQVRIPPQICDYSIYIIDEVHMLSAQAFNAFLKTLEEPPPHAIFILATTEKHKIIPTILSRCQIFDFNRIKIGDITSYLLYVAENESVSIDEDALNIIALKADGAMRDALSIFDQIVSFAGNSISYKDVIDNLNVLDYEYFFKLTDSFLDGNIIDALLLFNEILEEGFDAHHFISGLSSHFRDLLVCRDEATLQLLEVGASIRETYRQQALRCNADFLLEALKISNDSDMNYKASMNKRLHVELTMLRLCNISKSSEPAERKRTESVSTRQSAVQKKLEPPATAKPDRVEEPSVHIKTYKSTLSIKETKKDDPKQTVQNEVQLKTDKEQEPAGEEATELTQETLEIQWNYYAGTLKDDNPRIFNTLSSNTPVLTESSHIHLVLNTQSQANSLKDAKGCLLAFLRNKFNKSEIELEIRVDKGKEDTTRKIYTDSDKLNYLREKNPNISKLQQQFNLDFGS
ncbi:MAG: DNA polymerase III subunit gamma/tau [Bacteroidetes bacterium]|nr:DNA polymerase III subunit gamma/tau [Bacteroidota bacterium]